MGFLLNAIRNGEMWDNIFPSALENRFVLRMQSANAWLKLSVSGETHQPIALRKDGTSLRDSAVHATVVTPNAVQIDHWDGSNMSPQYSRNRSSGGFYGASGIWFRIAFSYRFDKVGVEYYGLRTSSMIPPWRMRNTSFLNFRLFQHIQRHSS
jgi:hypothetical protein